MSSFLCQWSGAQDDFDFLRAESSTVSRLTLVVYPSSSGRSGKVISCRCSAPKESP